MCLITSYSSFFNFKLVEDIIDLIDYAEGKRLIEEYKGEFAVYVKRRVTQCPSEIGMKGSGHVCFMVHLDKTYMHCRMVHLITLRDDVCEILHIKQDFLQIEGVEPGSISVVFHLFKHLMENIFPFTSDEICQLRLLCNGYGAKIMRVKCEGYLFEINNMKNDGKCNILYRMFFYNQNYTLKSVYPHFISLLNY